MAASENDVQTYTDTDFAMDTVVSETLYTTGDDINSKLTAVLTDVETNLLSWTNEKSQIYKVNADSGKDTEISDELSGYLKRLLKIAEDSDGAFDPTIGKLIRLWDIGGENQKIPEEAEIKNVLKWIPDIRRFFLTEIRSTWRRAVLWILEQRERVLAVT